MQAELSSNVGQRRRRAQLPWREVGVFDDEKVLPAYQFPGEKRKYFISILCKKCEYKIYEIYLLKKIWNEINVNNT